MGQNGKSTSLLLLCIDKRMKPMRMLPSFRTKLLPCSCVIYCHIISHMNPATGRQIRFAARLHTDVITSSRSPSCGGWALRVTSHQSKQATGASYDLHRQCLAKCLQQSLSTAASDLSGYDAFAGGTTCMCKWLWRICVE